MIANQITYMARRLYAMDSAPGDGSQYHPFIGRAIPLLGVIILSAEASQIIFCTIRDYNAIARGDDKIW